MSLILAGQMIVTDTSSGSERAGALGLLGISYGVGMVIGPFIGGLVTKFFR
jgi:OCT family organic cation transporter-like MFS transporter 18